MNTYTHLQESTRPTQRSRECDGWEGKRCSGPACFVSWPPSGCGACRSLLHVLQVSFACVAGLFCMCYRSLFHLLRVFFACDTRLVCVCSCWLVFHVRCLAGVSCEVSGWCFMCGVWLVFHVRCPAGVSCQVSCWCFMCGVFGSVVVFPVIVFRVLCSRYCVWCPLLRK